MELLLQREEANEISDEVKVLKTCLLRLFMEIWHTTQGIPTVCICQVVLLNKNNSEKGHLLPIGSCSKLLSTKKNTRSIDIISDMD